MVDSVCYWAKEYHVDGFRFDLMALHDVATMQAIEKALHKINPKAIIYGEGWTGGTSALPSNQQMTQANIFKIEATEGAAGSLAVFSDTIRDGLKGSVFEALGKGYINGAAASNVSKVQFGINGGSGTGVSWKVPGAAVINYMSAHDNNTLWDKLAMANADATVEQRLAMNRLGAVILMISKGTPFWQAGEEMLRSKPDGKGGFDENSYSSSDEVNNIVWNALAPNSDALRMMSYYQGLIAMRKEYEIFRGAEDVTITFTNLSGGAMSCLFENGKGQKALVVLNPSETALTYALDGNWNLVADGTMAGIAVLAEESGSVTVDACSAKVYVN
jgi:pullulanase